MAHTQAAASTMSNNNQLVRNVTEKVFYDDTLERSGFMLFYATLIPYCLVSNGILGLTIKRYAKFHTPHFVLVLVYISTDVIACACQSATRLLLLALKEKLLMGFCQCTTFIASSALSISIHLLTLISIERWIFFCKPYSYLHAMSMKNVARMLASLVALTFIIMGALDLYKPRNMLRTSTLSCVSESHNLLQNILFFGVYLLPSGVSTIFSLVKIYKAARHLNSIIPVVNIAYVLPPPSVGTGVGVTNPTTANITTPGTDSIQHAPPHQPSTPPADNLPHIAICHQFQASQSPRNITSSSSPASSSNNIVINHKRVLRMILVVSGVFWLTLIPGFGISTWILMSGVTWSDLDLRNVSPSILAWHRISMFTFYDLPKILNPLVILYTHPQLRSSVKKLLRKTQS